MAATFYGRNLWLAPAVAGAAIILGLSGCKKSGNAEDEEAPPPPPAAAPATPVPATPTPAPVVKAAPTPAPTPAPQLAPPGVFYLLSTVSIETSDGILGLKPGQQLQEVRPGVYKAGANEVSLRPDQVTNDLTVIRRVVMQDQASQTALRQRLGGPPRNAAPTPGRPTAAGAAGSVPPQDDPKVAARKELVQQLDELNQANQNVTAALNQASAHWAGNWDVASKKSPQVSQLLQQYNAIQQQRTEVAAKLAAMQ